MENIDPEKTPSFVFETIKLLNFCLEQVRSFETKEISGWFMTRIPDMLSMYSLQIPEKSNQSENKLWVNSSYL